MMDIVRRKWFDVLGVCLGVALAIIATPFLAETGNYFQDLYDARNPPAVAELAMSHWVTPDTLRIRMMVTRKRDCTIARMVAFTGNSSQKMQPANTVRREDGEAPMDYPLGITVLSRQWLIYPVYGKRLLLIGHYECGDRLVRAPMINELVP